jgi:hypothetical protein
LIQLIKGRKAWNDLVQKTKNPCRFDLCKMRKMKSKRRRRRRRRSKDCDYYYYYYYYNYYVNLCKI